MEWTRAEVWARLLELQNFVPADCKLSPHEVARLIGGNRVCLTAWLLDKCRRRNPVSSVSRNARLAGTKIAKSEILSGHPLASIPR